MATYTDDTKMPWGKHKGLKLKDVPADYFIWLMEQAWLPDWPELHRYIKSNTTAIYKEHEDDHVDDDDERPFGSYQDFLDNR